MTASGKTIFSEESVHGIWLKNKKNVKYYIAEIKRFKGQNKFCIAPPITLLFANQRINRLINLFIFCCHQKKRSIKAHKVRHLHRTTTGKKILVCLHGLLKGTISDPKFKTSLFSGKKFTIINYI